MHKRIGNTAISLSRLLNAMIGGNPAESLSGRCYREDIGWGKTVIDTLFFFQPNHCLHSHIEDRVDAKNLLGVYYRDPEDKAKVDQWDWR